MDNVGTTQQELSCDKWSLCLDDIAVVYDTFMNAMYYAMD
jgi:hypothetical protein